MNVKTRESSKPLTTNYNLKLLKYDKNQLLTEIKNLHFLVQKSGSNINDAQCELLKKSFPNLYEAFPLMYNNIIDDPSLPLNILTKMIETAYKIGENKTSGEIERLEIANLLNNYYIEKKS